MGPPCGCGVTVLLVVVLVSLPYTTTQAALTADVTESYERIPGPPSNLMAEPRDGNSVYLTWRPPQYTGHIPLYYSIYSQPQGGGYKMQEGTTASQYMVRNLSPHTNYSFYVETYNPLTDTFSTQHSNIITVSTGAAVCDVPEVRHARLAENRTSYTAGERAELVCELGYRLPYTKSTTLHVRCTQHGSWTNYIGPDKIPTCEKIGSCPSPDIPHSVPLDREGGFMPGDVIPLKCQPGYHASHQYLIVCGKDGTWRSKKSDDLLPSCRVLTCKIPAEFPHGSIKIVLNPDLEDEIYDRDEVPDSSSIQYSCDPGYILDNRHRIELRCIHGAWSDSQPYCIRELGYPGCSPPKLIPHASPEISARDGAVILGDVLPQGTQVSYRCDEGYSTYGHHNYLLICLDGKWIGQPPTCVPMAQTCDPPPSISHGNFMAQGANGQTVVTVDGPQYTDEVEVHYYCDTGYRLHDSNLSKLVCARTQWKGIIPICERRTKCDRPLDIENGNWLIKMFVIPEFGIGTKIAYICMDGYKQIGTGQIECLPSGYWSDHAPQCLPANAYCDEPGPVENGVYMCNPPHCDLFKIGTAVHYVCNKDHTPRDGDLMVQRCMSGGRWSGQKPVCQHVRLKTIPDPLQLNSNTLTVVIATSCGVLGLLAIIMLIVALQRRHKPRSSRICHPSTPPPPPYPTPPTGLVDEPDRVALIAFADGIQVVLPSYDEAVRGRPSSRLARYNSDSTRGSIRSSTSRGDYRPLPSLPSGVRTAGSQLRELPADHHRDHHRNSIITTTSITTRDNLSLTLGSIDTMNISDGTSTTVTVDTASSNPSIATSQRAAAGSIESSSTNGSIATEDAPLLEQNHYPTETLRSHHSNTSDTTHNASQRCQCPDRSGYDTLHSQSSRSQSDSSPIVELPEENKQSL